MKAIIFIRDIFRKYPKLLTTNAILVSVVSIVEVCSLLTVGPLVDFLVTPDLGHASNLTKRIIGMMNFFGIPVSLLSYMVLFVIFITLTSGFLIFARYSIYKTKYALNRDIVVGSFDDFFAAKWYFFSSGSQGVFLNTFIRELNVVGDAFGTMAIFFATCVQLLFCLVVPFFISWQVTVVSLSAALLFAWPFNLLGKTCYRLGQLNTSTANQVGIVIQESLNLTKVILGFGNQQKSRDNLKRSFDAHIDATIRSQTLGVAIPILYQPFGAAVLIIALIAARRFGVSLAETAVLLLVLLRVVFSIGSLASCKNSLENFFPSYEQIKSLRAKAKELKQTSGDRLFTRFDKEITISDVSFAYPGHKPVLSDINIRILKGSMVAVVGESGAGKSTLVDIIMGFHDPAKGRILFDGIDLCQLDINSYRRKIGYVPQDAVLFNMSIKDNLLWSKGDATEQEIRHACIQANADEFIEKFPRGYDTIAGDRGVCLSGGQRQRIALARAILRRPEILFLDEATSSLDTQSERLIQQAIDSIAKETTIIVIAHRLSTIVNADYVYVLKAGRLIEEGTYADLSNINGHFNRMVKLQLLEANSQADAVNKGIS